MLIQYWVRASFFWEFLKVLLIFLHCLLNIIEHLNIPWIILLQEAARHLFLTLVYSIQIECHGSLSAGVDMHR